MAHTNNIKINSLIENFVDKKCWSIIFGKGSGSVLHLGFGDKKKRQNILSNECLTSDENIYEADHSVMIYCSWRLSSTDEVLCGWKDMGDVENSNIKNLELIRDKKVVSVGVASVSYDLCLNFSNSLKLQLFCDETNDEVSDDNYIIFSNNIVISVGLKSILLQEDG